MTLLPFTLEAWDHGRGLQPCTADGREVKQLTLFECIQDYPLYGVVDGLLYEWNTVGEHRNSSYKGRFLRLRPKTEKRWIQVCRNLSGIERAFLSVHKPPTQCDEIALLEIEVPVP